MFDKCSTGNRQQEGSDEVHIWPHGQTSGCKDEYGHATFVYKIYDKKKVIKRYNFASSSDIDMAMLLLSSVCLAFHHPGLVFRNV